MDLYVDILLRLLSLLHRKEKFYVFFPFFLLFVFFFHVIGILMQVHIHYSWPWGYFVCDHMLRPHSR